MLPLTVVLEIRRLLDEGELTQRAIAEKLRVSRGSVGAIANGHRGLFGKGGPAPPASAAEVDPLPMRCPGCGGMVYQPCRLCRTREQPDPIGVQRRLAIAAPQRPLDGPRRVA